MRQKNRRRNLLTLYHHKYNKPNNNHLLHSDKSTNVALRFGHFSGRKVPNDKRPVLFSPEKRGFLEKMMSYVHLSLAHNTCFYRLNKLVSKFHLGPQNLMPTSIPLLVSGVGLLMLLGILINPNVNILDTNNIAYAQGSSTEEGVSPQAGNMSVQLTLKDPQVDTLTTQAETGKVNYISKGFTVKTANVDGYNVYVQTAPGSSNKLQNGSISIDFVKTENTAPDNFTDNSWGYKVDATGSLPQNLTYSPVPEATATNLNPAYSSNSTGETKDFTLNFAAKFADDATAGHYTTGILLSVAAGAGEVTKTWDTIEYMQDMTPEICAGGNESGKQLIDNRDNKKYWVAKLKDGNCWMTQNLDLNLQAGKELTPADSDVTSNWNPGQTTITGTLSTSVWPTPENFQNTSIDEANIVRSYDAGEYVYTTPTTANKCDNTANGLSDCTSKGWANVNGMAASSDPNFGTDVTNNTYNAHYLAGNQYSWVAATAGSGANITSTNSNDYPTEANQSICPKGWKLPLSGSSNDSESGSFNNLIRVSYAIQITTEGYKIGISPFYFLLGGTAYGDALQNAGSKGFYWSSTSSKNTFAHYMTFTANSLAPTDTGMRYIGGSVRCIAK